MNFAAYRYLVLSDLYRIYPNTRSSNLLRNILFGESFKYIFWMRTCRYLRSNKWLKYSLYPIALCLLNHYRYALGIGIPFTTEIGPGFYIGHFGGIFIHPHCTIGKNCNISQGVTIGNTARGKNKGVPTIGDDVYIGPGAKIIGAITIGNHAAIGTNCVVTRDVPDHAVVVGIPGKIISYEGSEGYVCFTDYENSFG